MTNTRNILQNKRISSLEAAGVKISLKSSTLRKKTVTPTFIKTTDDTASSDSSNKTTRTESNRFNPSSGLEIAIKNEESSATPSSSLLVRNATCCLTSTNFSPGSRKSSTSSKLSNVSPSSSSTGSTSSSSAQQPTPLKNSLKSRKSMSAATKSSSKIASRIYCKSTSLQNSEKLKDKNDILQATLTKKEAVLKVKDKQLEDLKNKLSLLQSEFEDRTPDHYISSESMCSNIKNTTSTVTKTTELEKTREPSLLKPYNRQHGKRRLLLSNEIEDFKRQAEKIKNDFESEKAVLIEQHETAMEKINADTKELIKQMRLEKENLSSILYEKDQLIEKLNTTIQEADQLHQNQIASLKSELNEQHVKDMDSLTSDHEKQISQLQLQIKYQKKQLNGDLQMLKNENELLHKRINDIEEENQQKINQLHTEHRAILETQNEFQKSEREKEQMNKEMTKPDKDAMILQNRSKNERFEDSNGLSSNQVGTQQNKMENSKVFHEAMSAMLLPKNNNYQDSIDIVDRETKFMETDNLNKDQKIVRDRKIQIDMLWNILAAGKEKEKNNVLAMKYDDLIKDEMNEHTENQNNTREPKADESDFEQEDKMTQTIQRKTTILEHTHKKAINHKSAPEKRLRKVKGQLEVYQACRGMKEIEDFIGDSTSVLLDNKYRQELETQEKIEQSLMKTNSNEQLGLTERLYYLAKITQLQDEVNRLYLELKKSVNTDMPSEQQGLYESSINEDRYDKGGLCLDNEITVIEKNEQKETPKRVKEEYDRNKNTEIEKRLQCIIEQHQKELNILQGQFQQLLDMKDQEMSDLSFRLKLTKQTEQNDYYFEQLEKSQYSKEGIIKPQYTEMQWLDLDNEQNEMNLEEKTILIKRLQSDITEMQKLIRKYKSEKDQLLRLVYELQEREYQ